MQSEFENGEFGRPQEPEQQGGRPGDLTGTSVQGLVTHGEDCDSLLRKMRAHKGISPGTDN